MIIKVKLTDECVGVSGVGGKRPTVDVLGNPVPPHTSEKGKSAILNRLRLDEKHYVVLPNVYHESIQVEVEGVKAAPAVLDMPAKPERSEKASKGNDEN